MNTNSLTNLALSPCVACETTTGVGIDMIRAVSMKTRRALAFINICQICNIHFLQKYIISKYSPRFKQYVDRITTYSIYLLKLYFFIYHVHSVFQ